MNMVKAALKSGEPFGIVLIKRGQEVGEPATPESVGTIAEIQTWDMRQLGVLDIGVVGGSRFRIAASRIGAHGLILADVENIADDVSAASQNLSVCATFPARIFAAGRNDIHGGRLLFDNAFWVGMRLAEMLPLVSTTKQKMLELTDATMRLELLAKYLIDQGLVSREKRYLPNPLVAN